MRSISALLFALAGMFGPSAAAQPTNFQHLIIVIQENRTPDNLFYALCATQHCSTHPGSAEYDIQTSHWLDKLAPRGTVKPGPAPLANTYDPTHSHPAFVATCDLNQSTSTCRMDGAGQAKCSQCPPHAQFKYVDNSSGIITPYLSLATQYGWANYMFQTNQGPSFPAHQFLFGATSAPSKKDDHSGIFMAENLSHVGDHIKPDNADNGCLAPLYARDQLINAQGFENPGNLIYPCVDHLTLADLLGKHAVAWRYYTPGAGDLWSAPDAIRHICRPANRQCTGPLWRKNVSLSPLYFLPDVAVCKLGGVTWVIPSGQFSDHAKANQGGGPAWVASIVNAIGNSTCQNSDGSSYWNSTAIVVTWDDWGGWYDHEPPTFLPYPEGGYQFGFRVPMIFVSAYTKAAYIDNGRHDFGSIARFVEHNFGIVEGALTFADKRSKDDLSSFYSFTMPARRFAAIPAPSLASVIGSGKPKLEPPDDD